MPGRSVADVGLSTETVRLARVVSRQGGLTGDQVGGLLGDHDDRRVEVARNDRRHDRGIDHAQAHDAADPAFGIDHRVRVAAHAAAARRVVRAFGVGPDPGVDVGIGPHLGARRHLAAAERIEGCLSEDLADNRDTGAHVLGIPRVGEIVEAEAGRGKRIVRGEP